MQRKKKEEKYIIIVFFLFTLNLFISCTHSNGQDPYTGWMFTSGARVTCIQVSAEPLEWGKCRRRPWAEIPIPHSVSGLLLPYQMKGDTIPFPWSMSTATFTHCFRPTRSQTKRPSVHMRSVFYFLNPPTKVRRALTMTSIVRFCGGGGWRKMVCQNLIFFIVKWKHSNPFE